jgi:tRNA(Ile)-lysidine synthase
VERNEPAQLAGSFSRLSFPWTILHSLLQEHLQTTQLLQPDTPILLAVSGGQDSLCLSQLLIDLQPRWQWRLAIGHCDHGWPQDAGIADRVRQIAAHWGLPFYCWQVQNLPETESAARTWRYQALTQMARTKNYTHIVTGHTQSDVAETLLYNLLRGSGSDGLSSLRPRRPLAERWLVRPLLQIDRRSTGEFCAQRQLPVWLDPYNDSPRYARNRMRRAIGNFETDFHPQVTAHLAQTAEILRAEADYLQELANGHYQQALVEPLVLDRRPLQTLPLALQRRVMRLFLQEHGLSPTFVAIQQAVTLLAAPRRSQTSSLRGGYLWVDENFIKIQRP